MSTMNESTSTSGYDRRVTIPIANVEFAVGFIDKSGMVEHLTTARAARAKSPGGRPAVVSDRAILALMFLLAMEGRPMHLTRAEEMVRYRLDDEAFALLGIDMTDTSWQTLYGRLRRAFARVVDAVDPYPGPRKKRLTYAESQEVKNQRDPEEVSAMNESLHVFCNLPITQTLSYVPEHAMNLFEGNYALDGTYIASGGKRGTDNRTGKYVNIEYDGSRHFRDGNHGDDDKKRKDVNGWGFEMQVVSKIRNGPGAPDLFPLLTVGIAFAEPAKEPGLNALKALEAVVAAGLPIKHLVADRAYYAGAAIENFHTQTDIWGFRPVTDYRVDQLGMSTTHSGAIQVEGWWYCSKMPEDLINATIRHQAKETTPEEYAAELIARRRYAAVLKGRANADGVVRWAHPEGIGHLCDPNRKHAPAFCKQKSVSMPREAGLKLRQEFQYGSPEWRGWYGLRNTVESMNALLKESGQQNIEKSSRRRARGRTAQFLLTSLMVAAENIRKIDAWAEADHELAAKRRAARPRVPYKFTTMNDDERAAIEAGRAVPAA